jgi:hypothetical protein
MQSLRAVAHQIDKDVTQCGYLLPGDLKVYCKSGSVFIAGLPAVSDHSGLQVGESLAPPYYGVVTSKYGDSIITDTLDIDEDGKTDFKANYGIISDSGAFQIMSHYSREHELIPLNDGSPAIGDRVVPAVVYQVSEDGLYRNAQLLAENIEKFSAALTGDDLKIFIKASRNGIAREISYNYTIR